MKKWTKEKIQKAVEILQNNTDYQKALDELGETPDALYNGFKRQGMSSPTEYLADDNEDVQRRQSLTKPKTSSGIKTMVIFNDVHIPFHNEAACRNVLRFCKDMQPDNIVINGDLLDCYSLSSFPKAPGMPDLQGELDIAAEMLHELRNNNPTATIDYLEGNHEERLKRVVLEKRAFFGLKALTIPSLLDLDSLDIAYHAYKHPVDFNGKVLSIVHGHRVRKHAGSTAKAQLVDSGFWNVIIGHTHRMGSYFHSGHYGRRRAYENGGLFCKEKLEYIVEPNWQNGFCVVYLMEDDPDFIQIIPIEMTDEGSFIWKGMLYES